MARKVLRPHQEDALWDLRYSLQASKDAGLPARPMLQAPTGFGKTLVAAKIAEAVNARGLPMVFSVPAIALIDQTLEAFNAEGITDIGVIQANHPEKKPDRPIQICSVQTLTKRDKPPAGVVIIDEAHRWFEFYRKWMGEFQPTSEGASTWIGPEEWRNVPFIGMSATPWTRGLGKYYRDLLIPITTQELIDKGYLSPFRVFAPSHPDLSGVRTVAGDYHEGQLSDVMSDKKLIADVVETWTRYGEGRPTLCFAVDRAHAKHLQANFVAAGVNAGYIDAYTSDAERKVVARAFASGEMPVVVNVGVLTTGVDWDVRCIILARPTRSEMLFVQIIGRGLRTADDHPVWGPKEDLLIFDHSDTHLRLGFVTDIHHEELDDGRERQKAKKRDKMTPLPKECPKCAFLKPAKVSQCPSCGFKPERQTGIACEDGELHEITKKGANENKRSQVPIEQKINIYGQLKRYATLRGYSKGWAFHKYKEYFGVEPSWMVDNAPERPVEPDVSSWVKSRQIAWAKSQKRQDKYATAA